MALEDSLVDLSWNSFPPLFLEESLDFQLPDPTDFASTLNETGTSGCVTLSETFPTSSSLTPKHAFYVGREELSGEAVVPDGLCVEKVVREREPSMPRKGCSNTSHLASEQVSFTFLPRGKCEELVISPAFLPLSPSTSPSSPPPLTPCSPEIKFEPELTPLEPWSPPDTKFNDHDDRACDDEAMDWERELEEIAREYDLGISTTSREKEELLALTVREFNRRVVEQGLDEKTVEYLKQIRRRRKNRLAAIRSRSRKDIKVTDLQKQVNQLLVENKSQKETIRALQTRLSLLEKKKR